MPEATLRATPPALLAGPQGGRTITNSQGLTERLRTLLFASHRCQGLCQPPLPIPSPAVHRSCESVHNTSRPWMQILTVQPRVRGAMLTNQPAAMPARCPRCNGQLLKGYDNDYSCLCC